VRVDDAPVDEGELLAEVEHLHAAAADPELRFFDLLTIAADRIFGRHGVDVGVYEAGIGGRLDSTAILRPRLVLLTSVGLDHTELLGETEDAILVEKLGVAPPGARVLTAPLAPKLQAVAQRVAEERGLRLEVVDAPLRPFLQNAALAASAAAALGVDHPGDFGPVAGRLDVAEVDGVDVVVDAAHNEQAWAALLASCAPPYVAVVAVSADKDTAALRRLLPRHVPVIATAHRGPVPARPARDLAQELGADAALDDPAAALEHALALALAKGDAGTRVLAFGSVHLAAAALRWRDARAS
jgi:folylpolyglutamate synthase/dihydropteroate synthase